MAFVGRDYHKSRGLCLGVVIAQRLIDRTRGAGHLMVERLHTASGAEQTDARGPLLARKIDSSEALNLRITQTTRHALWWLRSGE